MAFGDFLRRNNKQPEVFSVNAINLNKIDTDRYVRPFQFNLRKDKQNFADAFIFSIINRIFGALHNITWVVNGVDYLAEDIVKFVENNSQLLIYDYWKNGYAVVFMEKNKLRLPVANEIKLDRNGRVINRNCVVIYSEPYAIERNTHINLIQPILRNINTLMNNSNFISDSLGIFGAITGKGMPISPAQKQELQESLKKDYGMGEDKYHFLISNADISYTPIELPVKDLELVEKVDKDLKWLCNFFNINPDLIFGESTFSNQSEAIKSFHTLCITPLAEILLAIARNLYINLDKSLTPSEKVITYNFSNVPEMNTTLSSMVKEKDAYLDYLIKLKENGIDVTDDLKKLYDSSRDLLTNV